MGVLLGSIDKTRVHAVVPQVIFTAKECKNAEADGDGVLGYGNLLLTDYMKKDRKLAIGKLKIAIQQKRLHNYYQKIMLLHDSCKVHKVRQFREVMDGYGFVEI